MIGTYSSLDSEVKEGKFTGYNEQGNIINEMNYRQGKLNGEEKEYYASSKVRRVGYYKDGKQDSVAITYYQSGGMKRVKHLRNDQLIAETCYNPDGTVATCSKEDVQPEFPGGQNALFQFMMTHQVYPEKAKAKEIEGTVYIQFVVSKTGEIIKVKLMKSAHPLLDEAALKVIKSMPAWKPGTNDGEPVDVIYTTPIKYSLQ